MGSTFDIFKATVNGPLWVEAVQGLREAKERMARLALTSPGEYFLHSQENGIVARQARNGPMSSDEHSRSPSKRKVMHYQ